MIIPVWVKVLEHLRQSCILKSDRTAEPAWDLIDSGGELVFPVYNNTVGALMSRKQIRVIHVEVGVECHYKGGGSLDSDSYGNCEKHSFIKKGDWWECENCPCCIHDKVYNKYPDMRE